MVLLWIMDNMKLFYKESSFIDLVHNLLTHLYFYCYIYSFCHLYDRQDYLFDLNWNNILKLFLEYGKIPMN